MSDGLGAGGRQLSVMIPTHNCGTLLETTLSSLSAQGLDEAQIEVVDDCSTLDDPEATVARVGEGRVRFHRHPENVGMVANFNACIARAERPWVQILHGDDFMLAGAYGTLSALATRFPDCSALFARCVVADELGRWRGTSRILGDDTCGRLVHDTAMWGLTPVQFAGVVFRREAADEVGRFDMARSHTADWDLWWRIARRFPVAYTNECLGAYRDYDGNHTSQLRRTAANIRQGLDQARTISLAEGCSDPQFFAMLFELAVHQARGYAGETDAFGSQLRAVLSFPRGLPRAKAAARLLLAHGFAVAAAARRRR